MEQQGVSKLNDRQTTKFAQAPFHSDSRNRGGNTKNRSRSRSRSNSKSHVRPDHRSDVHNSGNDSRKKREDKTTSDEKKTPVIDSNVPFTFSSKDSIPIMNQVSPKGTNKSESNRAARRLYIGNIPAQLNEHELIHLFNSAMITNDRGNPELPPVINAEINHSKTFAFIEFRTPEDCSNGVLFDGIMFHGCALKVRRPKVYIPTDGKEDLAPGTIRIPGIIPTNLPDSPNKLFLGNIPKTMKESELIEIISRYGEIKALNIIKEAGHTLSRGYAFFEYVDPNVSDFAIQQLSKLTIEDKLLVCQRANMEQSKTNSNRMKSMYPNNFLPDMKLHVLPPGSLGTLPNISIYPHAHPHPQHWHIQNQQQLAMYNFSPMSAFTPIETFPMGPPSRVLRLSNMVTKKELINDKEYREIFDDISMECSRYGRVISIQIPRPTGNPQIDYYNSGIGQVYVEFDELNTAQFAATVLQRRQFALRNVIPIFYNEDKYSRSEFV